MTLIEELREEARGEIKAAEGYRHLASRLRGAGHYSEGNLVDAIADDENKHASLLMTMANSIMSKGEHEPSLTDEINEAYEHAKRTGKVTTSPFSEPRPFPKTYGDWVSLGENIKERDSDPRTWGEVNIALNSLSNEAADEQEVSNAQRYLTTKAGELGVC